jgi:hypothetical protein
MLSARGQIQRALTRVAAGKRFFWADQSWESAFSKDFILFYLLEITFEIASGKRRFRLL